MARSLKSDGVNIQVFGVLFSDKPFKAIYMG